MAPLHSYNEKEISMKDISFVIRAIDGARTRGLDLGKVARYQLRHYRISEIVTEKYLPQRQNIYYYKRVGLSNVFLLFLEKNYKIESA